VASGTDLHNLLNNSVENDGCIMPVGKLYHRNDFPYMVNKPYIVSRLYSYLGQY